MTKLLISALAVLLACGCGGDSFSSDEGGGGTGGGGAGASEGGSDRGGRASDSGAGQGGTANAGRASAGDDSGGGGAEGGKATGGSASGGASSGGMSGGGGSTATDSCEVDEDCVACAYAVAPTTVLDCDCVGCPDTPMNVDSCNANQMRWDKVCGAVDLACAPIKCLPPPPVRCEKGRCVDTQ